jgi:hypothetical protein
VSLRVRGKGNKLRPVPRYADVAAALDAWREQREQIPELTNDKLLFPGSVSVAATDLPGRRRTTVDQGVGPDRPADHARSRRARAPSATHTPSGTPSGGCTWPRQEPSSRACSGSWGTPCRTRPAGTCITTSTSSAPSIAGSAEVRRSRPPPTGPPRGTSRPRPSRQSWRARRLTLAAGCRAELQPSPMARSPAVVPKQQPGTPSCARGLCTWANPLVRRGADRARSGRLLCRIGIAGSARVGTIALQECDRRAAGAVRRSRTAEFGRKQSRGVWHGDASFRAKRKSAPTRPNVLRVLARARRVS